MPPKYTDLLHTKEPIVRSKSPKKSRRKAPVMLEQSAMIDECDFNEGAENEIEVKVVQRVQISELQTQEKRMQYKNMRIHAEEECVIIR